MSFDGSSCRLRDMRGFHYLAHLLRAPGVEIHCLELLAAAAVAAASADNREAVLLLDARAKEEYRRRLGDLRGELAEAEANNDNGPSRALP